MFFFVGLGFFPLFSNKIQLLSLLSDVSGIFWGSQSFADHSTENNDNYVKHYLSFVCPHFVLSPAAPLGLLFIPRSRNTTGYLGTFWIWIPLSLSVEAFSSNLSFGWLGMKREDGELFFPSLTSTTSCAFTKIPPRLYPRAFIPFCSLSHLTSPPCWSNCSRDEFSSPQTHFHCLSFACASCQGGFLWH